MEQKINGWAKLEVKAWSFQHFIFIQTFINGLHSQVGYKQMSFFHRVDGLLRNSKLEEEPLIFHIKRSHFNWVQTSLKDASLLIYSEYFPTGREQSWGITYSIWFGNASELPRRRGGESHRTVMTSLLTTETFLTSICLLGRAWVNIPPPPPLPPPPCKQFSLPLYQSASHMSSHFEPQLQPISVIMKMGRLISDIHGSFGLIKIWSAIFWG